MPIVFVHGVGTRLGKAYHNGVAMKRKFLDDHFADLTIEGKRVGGCEDWSFPYWGDLGAQFRWNMASLPAAHRTGESLGSDDQIEIQEVLATWALKARAT